jgi:hypothetical protein
VSAKEMSMHHQFANQELSRLSYAEAIRNSRRPDDVVNEVEERVSRSRSLLDRVREAVGDAFAQAPTPRPAS